MSNDWILDVLTDLRAFARQNGYGALAEQLDDTVLVAAGELAFPPAARPQTASAYEQAAGGLLREPATSE